MRMGTRFDMLGRTVQTTAPVFESGHSGYFSTPQSTLDPNLFNGDHIKPEVRHEILETFFSYMSKYRGARYWCTVWLAGSGISYQWAGDRGNGDLDVLIGVDWVKFYSNNADYRGLSESELVKYIDDDLKQNLWPTTAHTRFGRQTYEVTYYINANASDIRSINPYAAYNLTTASWTVRPPKLPSDPSSLYPDTYWNAVNSESNLARQIVSRFNDAKSRASKLTKGSPQWENAMNDLSLAVSQGRTLFDDIHLGRHNAFGPGGSGYGDYYNFRWQAHKQSGVVQALHELANASAESRKAEQTSYAGSPIKSATEALTEAAFWRKQL